MNKLIFEKIEIENFLSFKDKQIFEFKNSGIHIITGENLDLQADSFDDDLKPKNGAGKSSITRSIDFVLFGDNPNKKIKIESLINKEAKKNLCVKLWFTCNGEKYRAERYRKFTGKGNSFLLFKEENGSYLDISFADIKLTQAKIEEIISINHDTFLKAIFLTREGPRSFIEMPWHERSQLLESIVRLDKLKEYGKKVKDKLTVDKKTLNDVLTEITSLNGSVSSIKKVIKDEVKRLRDKKNNNKNKIQSLNAEILDLSLGRDPKEFFDTSKLYYDLLKEKLTLVKEIKDKEATNSKTETSIMKDTSFVGALQSQRSALLNKIKTEENSHDRFCKHCGKEPNDYHSKLIDQLNGEVKAKDEAISELQSSIKSNELLISQLKKEIEPLKEKVEDFNKKIKPIELPIKLKKGIETAILNNEPFISDKFFKDISDRLTEIENLKKEKIDLGSIINSHKSLNLSRGQLLFFKEKEKALRHKIELGEFWDGALDFRNEGSLKNYIMAKVVPIFNNILDSLINIIFDGTLSITFDNSWNETIIKDNYNYDYENLSLGEKTKINICISLALYSLLRINVTEVNSLFMDEIFSSVDEVTINKFISIFKASYNDISIYCISHESGFKNFKPDSTIKIVKKDGISRISA